MDSRFRGNDGGNPHILREKLSLEFPQNDREKVHSIPANAAEFREKNAVIPAKAGIYSGRLVLEFREFYGEIKFGISAHFFCEKRDVCGGLSVKMDSRVRGNDGGEAGIPAAFSFFSKLKTINRVHLEFAVFGEIPEVFPFETGRRADLPIVVAEFGFQI